MPGLCGFALSRQENHPGEGRGEPAALLDALLESLRHHPDHAAVASFLDGDLAAGMVLRVPGLAGGYWRGPQNLHVWVDGEAFGPDGLLSVEETADRLTRGVVPEILNGAFAAVAYDATRKILRLITDPYGLKFLYLRSGPAPAWCGELRGFLRMPGPPPEVDPECLRQLLEHGHPLGALSWFRDVELLDAGTVATFDLDAGTQSRERYFRMEREREATRTGWKDATAELGSLFRQAVERRSLDGRRLGVTLSGGLDSRALLAAVPAAAGNPDTVTFGTPGCADAVLAARASALRGSPHVFFTLGSDNWLEERFPHVIGTEGCIGILDLHGMESLPEIERRMEVCLHGFLGDALLGGSYLDHGNSLTGRYRDRGRRLILQALHYSGTRLHFRLPFLDLALTERVLSLPRAWLKDSRIYRAMLLREFPEYFQSLPWEKTGLPISASRPRLFLRRIARKLSRMLRGDPRGTAPGYADYPRWLRKGSAAITLRERLGPEALLHRFVPAAETARLLESHFAGRDESQALGRRLTAEVWLEYLNDRGALNAGAPSPARQKFTEGTTCA